MIACPICGADTRVKETRGNQRRRVCQSPDCPGKTVTLEVAREDLAMVRKLFDAMEGRDEQT